MGRHRGALQGCPSGALREQNEPLFLEISAFFLLLTQRVKVKCNWLRGSARLPGCMNSGRTLCVLTPSTHHAGLFAIGLAIRAFGSHLRDRCQSQEEELFFHFTGLNLRVVTERLALTGGDTLAHLTVRGTKKTALPQRCGGRETAFSGQLVLREERCLE